MKSLKSLKIVTLCAVAAVTSVIATLGISLSKSQSVQEVKADYAVSLSDRLNASGDTRRIWFVNNCGNFWSSSARMGLMVTSGVSGAPVFTSAAVSATGQAYFYWDVPLSASKVKVLRLNPDQNTCWGEVAELDLSFYSTSLLCYVNESGWSWWISFGSTNNMSAELFKTILTGYVTCSSSSKNGYGAYTALYNTFYDRDCMTSDIKNQLSTLTMDDYSYDNYTANGGSYTGIFKTSNSISVAAKWSGLQTAAAKGGLSGTAVINSPNSEPGIVGLTAISLLGIGTTISFFLMKKKRRV